MEINFCKKNLFNNRQQKYLFQKYTLSNLSAFSHIGNRALQEDSNIIDVHPLSEMICLMGVADGMGGLKNGAMASNISLRLLTDWFENLSLHKLYSDLELSQSVTDVLYLIDGILRENCCGGGTTLSFSIIREDSALCVNVGDSRIYCKHGTVLQQVSHDHSLSWRLWEKGIIPTKEAICFHKKNNLIISRLGCNKRLLEIEKITIDEHQYDNIYIFSDGVTDCLTDKQLEAIVSHPNCMPQDIVNYALQNTLTQNYLNNENYYNKINGGKDNATAVVYCKKRRLSNEI